MTLSHWKMRTSVLFLTGGLFLFGASPSLAQGKKTGTMDVISDGKKVSIEYTLTLEDKTKVGSNVGQDPLVFTQGNHEIIPGLEKQLNGLKAGDSKRVEVSPEEGYGNVDPARTQEVPKERVPEDARKVGAKLTGQGPDGQLLFAEVTEIKDNTIVLDMNHPLAGKKLIFDVKVLKVEDGDGQKVQSAPPPAKPAK
jgi:FKBP-type peptidyl-prolyl cis-trans isomerase 2